MIDAATYLAVNDYEARLLVEQTGLTLEDLARRVEALVVTLGAEGSKIHVDGHVLAIPAVRPRRWSTRPAAATLTAPACCTASRQGWDWADDRPAGGGDGRRSRSRRAAARTTRSAATTVGARYHDTFGSYPW